MGFSAYAMRSPRAATTDAVASPEPQISNQAAKTDRMLLPVRTAMLPSDRTGFMLASASQGADLEHFYGTLATARAAGAAPIPNAEPVRTAAIAKPLPPPKPKAAAEPPNGLFDEGQIAGIKSRLKLTAAQLEHWPAVEQALRDVVKHQLQAMRRRPSPSGVGHIDVNSPEVQRLIWAAMPLLMQLREDQKREVRKLVRVIGLEAVASQI